MATRVRAGGRSELVRRKVGRACLDLLTEGRTALGPAEVAQRAGVSRATVYRWWPTTADLLREALALHTGRRVDPPDTGTWQGDVRALARRLAAFFSDPAEVAQNAIMATGSAPDYEAIVLERFEPVFDAWRSMVDKGRERGEVRDDVDTDSVLLTLASPLLVVPLLFHRTLSTDEVRRIADLVHAGTAVSAGLAGTVVSASVSGRAER